MITPSPSPSPSPSPTPSPTPSPSPEPHDLPLRLDADLPIVGMTCAGCAGRLERTLGAVEGVSEATVNFATRRARVTFDPAVASRASLEAAIDGAGFSVPVAPQPPPAEESSAEPSAEPALAPSVADLADRAAEVEQRGLGRDALLAGVLTAPLLVLGMSHGAIPWSESSTGQIVQLALATVVVFGPGRRFFVQAGRTLRHGAADMNTLVAMGTFASWAYSAMVLAMPAIRGASHAGHAAPQHVYFEAAAAIVAFVLFGKWLEARSRIKLADAVRGLVSLVPAQATRLEAGDASAEASVEGRAGGEATEREVAVAALRVGDSVLVRPGARVPIDGVVQRGESAVDESMLTGESLPTDKATGSTVVAGTMNQTGALVVRVTRVGKDTALARIVEAVEKAQGSRAPIARLADRVSGIFVPVVLACAVLAFAVWFAIDPTTSGATTALARAVAVLVIACPCALGLATPAAIAVGTGRGAELGVLVKGGVALETASRVDTVFLDKTGTLTLGKPSLVAFSDVRGAPSRGLLALVAAAESASEHPVARAIVAGAAQRGVEPRTATDFRSRPGAGVEARVDGRRVRVGTRAFLAEGGVDAGPLEGAAEELARAGKTPSFVAVDGVLAGLVAVADTVSPVARGAVAELRALGLDVAMLTGDRRAVAEAVAAELGIERVHAELSPQGKADLATAERAKGRIVAMVGDGVNDAPALAASSVGIAIGSGTDIAMAAADLTLLRGGIATLPTALRLARRTLSTIRGNLFWAFAYNVVGIPIAAGALYPLTGWLLSPVIASAAMSLSSVSVLLSSLRLRSFERDT